MFTANWVSMSVGDIIILKVDKIGIKSTGMSFIRYRIMRIRRLTKNKVYLIIRSLLFLYLRIKIKLGWY